MTMRETPSPSWRESENLPSELADGGDGRIGDGAVSGREGSGFGDSTASTARFAGAAGGGAGTTAPRSGAGSKATSATGGGSAIASGRTLTAALPGFAAADAPGGAVAVLSLAIGPPRTGVLPAAAGAGTGLVTAALALAPVPVLKSMTIRTGL